MKVLLPQQIESRWIIPAVRSIIAHELIERYEFNQSDVAELLGVTQAAINNYMRGNRGEREIIKKLKRDKQVMLMVNDIAKNLNRNHQFTPRCMSKYIELFNYTRRSLLICRIHRRLERDIDDELCKTCEKFILKVA